MRRGSVFRYQQTQSEIDGRRNQGRSQGFVRHIVRQIELHRQKSRQEQTDQLRDESTPKKKSHAQKHQGELEETEKKGEKAQNDDPRMGVDRQAAN